VAIYLGVCEELYKRHAYDFMAVVTPCWRNYRPWFARSQEVLDTEYARSKRVPGSPLFAFMHMSSKSLHQRSRRLLQAFGYSRSELQLLFD